MLFNLISEIFWRKFLCHTMPHFWRRTSFCAKNDVILTIFYYFDQLFGILTNLTWFLPTKTTHEVDQLGKWNILQKLFLHTMAHFWRRTSFCAKNDVILAIFLYFDQLLGILTTLTWFLPTKTLAEVVQLGKWNISIFYIPWPIFDVERHFAPKMTSFWPFSLLWPVIGHFDHFNLVFTHQNHAWGC